ncbi:MAG: hypothetical protein AAFR35_07440 [Pseudomonadota bacterium]
MKTILNWDEDAVADGDVGRSIDILAVGDVSRWEQANGQRPVNAHIAFVEFHEISDVFLETVQPMMVISPLLTDTFDCIDLASVLSSLGFAGQYRAIAGSIPSPDIVRRELNSLCPDLDFDIVNLPDGTLDRPN